MSWTYSDYQTLTDTAARYARRALFLTELLNAITPELGSDNYNKSTQAIERLYERVKAEHDNDTAGSAAGTNGGMSVGRLVRCRDAR